MLKMGLPLGAVQNSMTKDGKDPTIMTLDHDKSLSSQLKRKDLGPPLKDDPDYSKYFKVSVRGVFCYYLDYNTALTHSYCILLAADAQDGTSNGCSTKCYAEGRKRYKYHYFRS